MKRILTLLGIGILFGGVLLVPNYVLAGNPLPTADDAPQEEQSEGGEESETGDASGSGTPQSSNPLGEGVSEFGGLNSGVRTDTELIPFIANIIRWTLGLVGTVFFVLVLFNGFKYMTAGGNGQATQQAVAGITNAVVGLVIIMGAFLITNFVTSALTSGGGSGGTTTGETTGYQVTVEDYV